MTRIVAALIVLLAGALYGQDSLRFVAAYDSSGFYNPETVITDGMMRGSSTYEGRDYGHNAVIDIGAGGGSADYRGWLALLPAAWDSIGTGVVIDSFRVSIYTTALQDEDTVRVWGLYGAVVEGTGTGTITGDGCGWLDFNQTSGYTWTLPGADSALDGGAWKAADSTGPDRTATEYAKAFVGAANDDSHIIWLVTDTAFIMDCYRNDRQFQVLFTHDNASNVRFAARENTGNESANILPWITIYYSAGAEPEPSASGDSWYRSSPDRAAYRSSPDGIAVRSRP